MLSRSIAVKILESEEDKKTIADVFERIDAHTKDFHVCISGSMAMFLCSFSAPSSTL
jgi:hypothetical protein